MEQQEENKRLTEEVKRLENELELQIEAEENNKQAMEEFALVIKEVAAEANQAKEKLASSEEQIQLLKEETATLKALVNSKQEENETLNNTIDRLRVEADESLLACSGKEIEFVKLIKEEEDEKARVLEENNKLMEELKELGNKSECLREETEKIRSVFQEALDEANVAREASEEAKAEKMKLKASLSQKERELAFLTQETQRLRVYEDAAHQNINKDNRSRRVLPAGETKSSHTQPITVAADLEAKGVEDKSLLLDPPNKNGSKEEEEQKKTLSSSSSKHDPPIKPNASGAEDKEKRLLPSFSRRSLLPSFSRKDIMKSLHSTTSSSSITTTSTSSTVEDKEPRKIKKDAHLVADKDNNLKGHGHSKSYGAFCFVPTAMIPLPGMASNKTKDVVGGDSSDKEDDAITDSIFDDVDSSQSPPSSLHSRKHRRTFSAINDDKSTSLEEFEHEESPHFDDMEVERAGSHSTKKKVLLWRFGDLLRRKNHHPLQNPTQSPNHNLNHKEVTT